MDQAIFDTSNHRYHDQLQEQIGLKADWVDTVAQRILTSFNQATPNDAVSAAGLNAYLTGVRAIRDILCPQGWEIVRQDNIELTRNPDTGIALVVSSGDINTGNRNRSPKTKNPKGEGTKNIVLQNSYSLFPELDDENTVELSSGPFWYFLYHIDLMKSEMRVEISLPVEMTFYGSRIDTWKTRLIHSPIDLDPSVIMPSPEFAETFDFEIRRKSNGKE